MNKCTERTEIHCTSVHLSIIEKYTKQNRKRPSTIQIVQGGWSRGRCKRPEGSEKAKEKRQMME
jgi:hypothetical protein